MKADWPTPAGSRPRTERWMWWVKDPQRYVFNLDAVRDGTLNRTTDERNNDLGKSPTDLWFFDRVTGGRASSKEKCGGIAMALSHRTPRPTNRLK
jgi:hypothetical protein